MVLKGNVNCFQGSGDKRGHLLQTQEEDNTQHSEMMTGPSLTENFSEGRVHACHPSYRLSQQTEVQSLDYTCYPSTQESEAGRT